METLEYGSDQWRSSLRNVSSILGKLHSNDALHSKTSSRLRPGNLEGGEGRYKDIEGQRQDGTAATFFPLKIGEATFTPANVRLRLQHLGTLIGNNKYKSKHVMVVKELHPGTIWFSDDGQCHSLAEDSKEGCLEFQDPLQPLVRLAFTTSCPFNRLEEDLVGPYWTAYCAGQDIPFDWERFHLLRHAMHLDFFLYFTHSKNLGQVEILAKRLLQDDAQFPDSHFDNLFVHWTE